MTTKTSIFKRLQGCDSEKCNEWVERTLSLPVQTFSKPPKIEEHQKIISKSREIMDGAITGHVDAKTAVLHMLCSWLRDGASGGFSLALEGEPGTGKTTFVKEALAPCVNRPFFFIGLGGATDASYLLGHSYTYEGAMHGRIAECLIEAGTMDPVIFFDELDKISSTAKGAEIVNTLIHLVDPTQNAHMRDKYFHGIDLDLSRAIMVFSYNDASRVDPVLLDRLRRVRIGAPTFDQKCEIVTRHLFPKLLGRMTMSDLKVSDDIVEAIVNRHKEESGMRGVEKTVSTVVSSLALAKMYGETSILGGKFRGSEKTEMSLEFVSRVLDGVEAQSPRRNPMSLMYC